MEYLPIFLGETLALAITDPLQIGMAFLAVYLQQRKKWAPLILVPSLALLTASVSVLFGILAHTSYSESDIALHVLSSAIAFAFDYLVILWMARALRLFSDPRTEKPSGF